MRPIRPRLALSAPPCSPPSPGPRHPGDGHGRHHRHPHRGGAAARQGRAAGDPAPQRIRRRGAGLRPALWRAYGPPRRPSESSPRGPGAVAAGGGPGAGPRPRGRGPEPGRRPAAVLGAARDDAGTAAVAAGLRALRSPTRRAARPLERSSRGQDSIDLPGGQAHQAHPGHRLRPVHSWTTTSAAPTPPGRPRSRWTARRSRTDGGPGPGRDRRVPRRWADFADGTVERTLRPHSVAEGRPVHHRQPGPARAVRRRAHQRGLARQLPRQRQHLADRDRALPCADPAPQPQWTTTTPPYEEIVAAHTGRFPVNDNTAVTEIPAGESEPVVRPDGPTQGSHGARGRWRRLPLQRDRLPCDAAARPARSEDPRRPCAHPGTGVRPRQHRPGHGRDHRPGVPTNRRDIIDQVRSILTVAATTTR